MAANGISHMPYACYELKFTTKSALNARITILLTILMEVKKKISSFKESYLFCRA